jgi:hypothetical protein
VNRRALAAAIAVAAILRGLPLLVPHLQIELQDGYPETAVIAIAARTWKPFSLVHGSVLSEILRALYTLWYGLGLALGRYHARIDLVVDFLRDPFPFIVTARIVVLAASLAGVWLAAWLAARIGGPLAGPAAALVLATCFIHVRESLHVWPDAVAATAAAATVALALVHLERGTRRTAIVLGIAAGLSLACKPAVFPLALPVALALWWGGEATIGARARGFGLAAAATLATFVVASPHYLIDWRELLLHVRVQMMGSLATSASRLAWWDLVQITLGRGPFLVAVVGLVVAVLRAARPATVVAAFPVAYLALLARANPFARYFAIAAPFVAVLAGVGIAGIVARIAPRRAGLEAAVIALLLVAVPAERSWSYVALIRRPDTRISAGEWLRAHVAPGTAVTLPNIVGYANPVVAPDALTLRLSLPLWHEALVAHGLGDPAKTFRLTYQGMLSTWNASWVPRDPIVVTATHPSPQPALATPAVNEERLRAAGYHVAARFTGVPEPTPPGLVYDPLEADYAPILGAELVPRLGPTLTIWQAPNAGGVAP